MKIKEYKNKIVLAEINPECDYILLYDCSQIPTDRIRKLEVPKGVFIQLIPVYDVDKAIRFVEIPKKPKLK